MHKMIVNLPVSDLQRSDEFFTRLGFSFDPRFTDENATCMLVGEDAYVMLLVCREDDPPLVEAAGVAPGVLLSGVLVHGLAQGRWML